MFDTDILTFERWRVKRLVSISLLPSAPTHFTHPMEMDELYSLIFGFLAKNELQKSGSVVD